MRRVINDTCIVPSIAGRLGNNMFMIANAYAKALEQNRQLVVSKYQVGHMGDFLDNIFRKLDVYIDMPDDVLNTGVATVYTGYFQSEKYFEKYSEAVKQLFSPTREFVENAYEKYAFLHHCRVTSISVRRGDYLIYKDYHPVVSKEYIEKALEFVGDECYMVFSDDLLWSRENLSHLKNVHFIEAPIHEQMWLMSMCNDFIISNSSFSWWGAYLSRDRRKKVVAPQTWFGPNGPSQWNDMYCNEWIVLPTTYVNGYIHPTH